MIMSQDTLTEKAASFKLPVPPPADRCAGLSTPGHSPTRRRRVPLRRLSESLNLNLTRQKLPVSATLPAASDPVSTGPLARSEAAGGAVGGGHCDCHPVPLGPRLWGLRIA